MRVTIRRRTTLTDGAEVDQEVELSADGSHSPDVMTDLITRAYELWDWTFDAETEA